MAERPRQFRQYQSLAQNPPLTTSQAERVQADKFYIGPPNPPIGLKPLAIAVIVATTLAWSTTTPVKFIQQSYPDQTRAIKSTPQYYPYFSWGHTTPISVDRWIGNYPSYIVRTPKKVITFLDSFKGVAETTQIDKWYSEPLSLMPNRRPQTNVYSHEHFFWGNVTPIPIDKWIWQYPDYIIKTPKKVIVFSDTIKVDPNPTEPTDASKWQAILPTNPVGYAPPKIIAVNDSYGIPIVPIDWYSEWQYYSVLNKRLSYYTSFPYLFTPDKVIPTTVPSFGWYSELQFYTRLNYQKNYYWEQQAYFSPTTLVSVITGHVRNLPLLGVG